MYKIETKTQLLPGHRLVIAAISAAFLLVLMTTAFADADPATLDDAYVDSVYDWGIWELGLEPASGPQLPANNAINDRSRKLQFRPNDNAAYMTQSVPIPPVSIITPPPVIPTTPTGPPGFSSGAPTTADPRN